VLPRNHFQTYNTFWKRGEATDKQQSIWFVWLVQITNCQAIFISVCFIQQSILCPCLTYLPPSQHFHSSASTPLLPSLPTESWHFFSAPIPSLLNSPHPSLLKFSFHFVIALALIFLPTHSLHSLHFPSTLHPSLNSFPFSRSQLQSFLFPKASNACSIHPKRQAGRQHCWCCETGPARPGPARPSPALSSAV